MLGNRRDNAGADGHQNGENEFGIGKVEYRIGAGQLQYLSFLFCLHEFLIAIRLDAFGLRTDADRENNGRKNADQSCDGHPDKALTPSVRGDDFCEDG